MNKGNIIKISTIITAVMAIIMIIFATFQARGKAQLKAEAAVSENYNISGMTITISNNSSANMSIINNNQYNTADIIISSTNWNNMTATFTMQPQNISIEFTKNTVKTISINENTSYQMGNIRGSGENTAEINIQVITYDITNTTGYDEGYQNGYTEGQNAGLETAQYGIWANATFTVTGTYTLNETQTNNYTESSAIINNYLIYNAIDTLDIYNYLYNKYCISSSNPDQYGTIDTANITITLQNEIQYNQNTYPLIWNGSNLGVTITLIDNNNNQYSVSLYDAENPTTEKGYINFPETTTNKIIKQIKITFAGAYNSMNGTLVAVNGNYQAGYDNGYNNGYGNGNTDGYNKGYQTGYDKGVIAGQQNATFENLTGFELLSSGLATIFEALDVPILWGKMSFADMISIILSIGLAFALIRFIVG